MKTDTVSDFIVKKIYFYDIFIRDIQQFCVFENIWATSSDFYSTNFSQTILNVFSFIYLISEYIFLNIGKVVWFY